MDAIALAFGLVFNVQTMLAIVGAALFGLFVGAVPGLTATMATALLVPVTFFMPPIATISPAEAASSSSNTRDAAGPTTTSSRWGTSVSRKVTGKPASVKK